MNEKKKLFASFFLGLFVGGLLAGVGNYFYRCYSKENFFYREHREMRHKKMVHEFTSKLRLNEEQKKKIENILDAKRKKIQELRKGIHPKFKELRESARSEIRALLTAGQQAKFDQITEKRDKRWKQKFESGQ